MRAIQIEEFGGLDVLQLQDVPAPEPGLRAHEDLQARRTSGKLLLDPAA